MTKFIPIHYACPCGFTSARYTAFVGHLKTCKEAEY